MEDTKQTNGNSPQPLSAEEATSISGGDGTASCPTTVTVSANPSIVTPAPNPSDGLIAVYEGFVDVTSHIIERVAAAAK
jgi:hypothetical protein